MTEQLERIWQALLEFTSMFVLPDWEFVIGLIPWAVLLFLVGPILTLLVLGWLIYVVRAPRTRVQFAEGPVVAPVGEDRTPKLPRGEPVCYRDGLIYPARARRCDECGDELAVYCPKCGLARSAAIGTCGNCGLELKFHDRTRTLQPVGPPPGGAAAA